MVFLDTIILGNSNKISNLVSILSKNKAMLCFQNRNGVGWRTDICYKIVVSLQFNMYLSWTHKGCNVWRIPTLVPKLNAIIPDHICPEWGLRPSSFQQLPPKFLCLFRDWSPQLCSRLFLIGALPLGFKLSAISHSSSSIPSCDACTEEKPYSGIPVALAIESLESPLHRTQAD